MPDEIVKTNKTNTASQIAGNFNRVDGGQFVTALYMNPSAEVKGNTITPVTIIV